jgi:DNA-binding NarL/FixJ family response regulator
MGGFPGDGKLSPAHGDPTARGVRIGNAVGDWNAGVSSNLGNPAFRRTFQTQSLPAVNTMTRVLLYSDEPILAQGFEAVLRQSEGFELLPTSVSLPVLMEQIAQGAPDVVLMDLTPEISFGVLSDMSQAINRSRIVLWVNAISNELAFQAMGLGVRGILRKTLPTELQVKCLQRVHAGELWFEKALTDGFLCARRVALTGREGQLVSLLSQGLKNKEIATALAISEGTVKVHLSRLFHKVGVKDRFELALFGRKNLSAGQLATDTKGKRPGRGVIHGLPSLMMEGRIETPAARPEAR